MPEIEVSYEGRCGRCGALRVAARNDRKCVSRIQERAMAQAAVVPAVVAARGERLATKAQQGRRTESSITRLQPAGRAAMKRKVERQAFGRGRKGDEAWAASTRDAAEGGAL